MKRSDYKRTSFITMAALVGLFLLILVLRSGRFSKAPTVAVSADNCYSETLTVITDEDYRPYSFYDAQGNYSGHDVELITIVANRLHMNLDLKFMSWQDGIEAINAGQADVLMTCDYSDSFPGMEKLLKTEPVSADEFLIYAKQKISSEDVLYGKKIAVMKNGNVMSEIRKMQLEKNCIFYPDNRAAMRALEKGELDYAVLRQTVGTVLLQELGISDIHGYVSIGQSDMCFGVNSSRPELVSAINGVLEELKMSGGMEELRGKWLTTFIKPYTFSEVISNNFWIVWVFAFLAAIVGITSFISYKRHRKEEEADERTKQVMEFLTQDFFCVNYVELTPSPKSDPVVNYRVSEELKNLIPGWEKETSFSRKLDLLCDSFVYEPDREQFRKETRRQRVLEAIRNETICYVNLRAFRNNEICYYQMKFSPVQEHGVLKGLVAGLHSVDAQTKREMTLQDQLQKALSQTEVASKAKTNFLFNMSHDIRTPLNAIAGFTNMAIKHIDDRERALDCLEKTQESGQLLLSLINSVLDVSRIESGKAVPEEKSFNVMLSFAGIESTMMELASTKNIALSFDYKNIRDRFVFCDINRCNRIFVNIISNAIKYTHENGFVKVLCEQLDEAPEGKAVYRYTFEDNGIGMSEEFQKHVFEQFAREQSVDQNGIQGTGLGLAVCKSFVELIGGTIECRSRLNEGTLFTVTLPFRLQENELYTDPATGIVMTSGKAAVYDTKQLEGKRILVVDDSTLNLEIVTDYLMEEGLVVETGTDGSDALKLLEEKGPRYYDCILMDIRMPGMGGYEATREIRKRYPDEKIPIIALSANAFEEDKKASQEAGMDGHVAKPINIHELFEVMMQCSV